MTVATEEPATSQSPSVQEQAAALERAYDSEVTTVDTPLQNGPKHAHNGAKQKAQKARNTTTLYIVGGVVAVIIALAVAGRQAAQDERVMAAVQDHVQRINTTLAEHVDGFLEHLEAWQDRVNNLLPGDESPRPGQLAAQAGLKAHHPIVIIPGFVTSGLELWQGEPCAQSYFRQRLWGTLSMAQTLLSDRMCWMRHMKLDPVTGSDPPGIKLRAAKALEAVDYFVPGYWVFSKLIQSLSDIGYDNNNLIAVPYDWRLPIPVMEKRDGFFTRVKHEVELQYQLSKEIKPILVSHSYGATVTVTFLHWVEQQEAGWVDKYLAGYANLAGPLLGLPKALSPMLSGETRETVDMMAGLAVLVEQYLGKQSRAALFRTWGSVMAMLPVGGPKVWGNATFAPDDDDEIKAAGRSYGGIIAEVRSGDSRLKDAVGKNDSSLLSSESLQLLRTTLHNWGHTIRSLGSTDPSDDSDNDVDDSSDTSKNGGKKQGSETASKQGAEGSKEGREEEAAKEDELQVRFLDVGSAITALARTAGEQLTVNLKKWSPAGQELHQQLDKVLEVQRQAAEALAERELASCCKTGLGEYQGTCSDSNGDSSDSGKSRGESGVVCTDEQEQKYKGMFEGTEGKSSGEGSCDSGSGSSIGSHEGSHEAEQIEASHKEDQGGGTDRDSKESSSGSGSSSSGGSSGSSGGETETQEGKGLNLIKALKKRVLGGSGDAQNSSSDPEMMGKGAVAPANVLQTPLPNAKHFKVYCMYGIGTPTERGYHYLKTRKQGRGGTVHTEWSVNPLADDPKSGLFDGVQLSPDGDGTVPLLSLGALCAGGWRTKRLNPAGAEVVIREYPNNPVPVLRDARGGPNASTHVEILGNEPMLHDLLHIAAGKHQDIKDSIHTKIEDIASKIPWDEL